MQRWEPFRGVDRPSQVMDRFFDACLWRPHRLMRAAFGRGGVTLDVYRTPLLRWHP